MSILEDKLSHLINENISSRLFPACVIGYIKDGRQNVIASGTYTYENLKPVRDDSIFDVASITKSIPVACLALKLIEEKRLSLTDEIGKYIPQCKDPKGDTITVWNLLTQTVYYEFGHRLSDLSHKAPEEILKTIFNTPARTSTTNVTYTNSSSILLGLIIEKIYQKNLSKVSQEIFFEPLDMKKTGFEPMSLDAREEIVPTEIDGHRGGLMQGVVHDESTFALTPKTVGSAGLFSTVPDLLVFMGLLLQHGRNKGKRYFKPDTIKQMSQNQLSGIESTGLGWQLNQPAFMGQYANGAFGKTGFTGCLFLCNLSKSAGIVILSNSVYPKRRNDFSSINQFRSSIADLVFAG